MNSDYVAEPGREIYATWAQRKWDDDHRMDGKKVRQQIDVGLYEPSTYNIQGKTLECQEMAKVHDIKQNIGKNQVTSSAIAFAPGWIF